jgi:hypothetical protein
MPAAMPPQGSGKAGVVNNDTLFFTPPLPSFREAKLHDGAIAVFTESETVAPQIHHLSRPEQAVEGGEEGQGGSTLASGPGATTQSDGHFRGQRLGSLNNFVPAPRRIKPPGELQVALRGRNCMLKPRQRIGSIRFRMAFQPQHLQKFTHHLVEQTRRFRITNPIRQQPVMKTPHADSVPLAGRLTNN